MNEVKKPLSRLQTEYTEVFSTPKITKVNLSVQCGVTNDFTEDGEYYTLYNSEEDGTDKDKPANKKMIHRFRWSQLQEAYDWWIDTYHDGYKEAIPRDLQLRDGITLTIDGKRQRCQKVREFWKSIGNELRRGMDVEQSATSTHVTETTEPKVKYGLYYVREFVEYFKPFRRIIDTVVHPPNPSLPTAE